MTDPKPPDNLSDKGVLPHNDLTVDGAPIDEAGSYIHLRAHETVLDLLFCLLLE